MTPQRRSRVAYLSYSTAEFDSRTLRMVRSALAAGYEVVVYAVLEPGLPVIEEREGYRIVRIPRDARLAIPGIRRLRRLATAGMRRAAPRSGASTGRVRTAASGARDVPSRVPRRPERTTSPFVRRLLKILEWRLTLPKPRLLLLFPLSPIGWAVALEAVAEPADIWHGMWAGSLPALGRLRRRYGGRTIYDSRDVLMHSRGFDRIHPAYRAVFRAFERRWARAADAVLTVNEAYADILAKTLVTERPPVVMNCPERWTRPEPPPNHIREALSLPATTQVVLYQGNLLTDRGIEQSMDAILEVPDACLVLMGYGAGTARYTELSEQKPYLGRVFVLPAVPPAELLAWTASADVAVMAIQPTTLNHRHTTPQKLFEAMAAGVPVVASNLPGMSAIVRATGCGVLCDPTSASAIAAAIRELLAARPAEREAFRAAALRAAHDRYNWETQVETLLDVYERLSSR